MSELIDRQVAIDSIYVVAESIICAVEEESPEIADKIVVVRDLILKKIKEQPTIEPKVRHGRWKKKNGEIYCTNCKKSKWSESFELMLRGFDFCPKCGADMRKGGADNGY